MSSEDFFDSELEELLKLDEITTPEEFLRRRKHVSEIGDALFRELPAPPDDYEERILYYFYYTVQFILLYTKLNGVKPVPDVANDSDDVIREKAYFIHLDHCYKQFNEIIQKMTTIIYNNIHERISKHLEHEKDHLLFKILKDIVIYKEMHSRRIKSDPSASRTKTTNINRTYNLITDEEYDPKNKDHKTWRMLIFNPLPSDFDYNAVDPNEGGREYALIIEVEKINKTYTVPDPFYIVVTTEWDKIFRLLHTLLHFDEYMHTYLIGCLTNEDFEQIEEFSEWKQVWEFVMKEHWDVPIKNLSREKKKTPNFVSRIAELRDFLKAMVDFESK